MLVFCMHYCMANKHQRIFLYFQSISCRLVVDYTFLIRKPIKLQTIDP